MPETSEMELRSYLTWLTSNIDGLSEEGLIAAYYQLSSYEPIAPFLKRYKQEFITAIQRRDIPAVAGFLRKIEADFTLSLSQEVVQTRTLKEMSHPTDTFSGNISERAREASEALQNVNTVSEQVRRSRREVNRAFIARLVQRYSQIPESQRAVLIDQLVFQSEEHPEIPAEQLLQRVVDDFLKDSPTVARAITKEKEITTRIQELQKNAATDVGDQITEVLIDAAKPSVALQAITTGVGALDKRPESLNKILERAELVSTASAIIDGSQQAAPDYKGFFSALAQSGGATEKALAPLADVVISVFPPETREVIATSIMSSLWRKETKDGGFAQGVLGAIFQSEMVRQTIQRGNSVFHTTSAGHILTPAQSFIGDVITTVFRPSISTVWVEIAQTNQKLLPSKLYQYYLSLLAKRGAEKAAKEVAKKLGKEATKKITAKTAGKGLGAALGSALMAVGVPPVIAQWLGAEILGKIFDKLLAFGEKVVGFVKGLLNYVGEPFFKEYGPVLGFVLIILLPVMFPMTGSFIPFLPNNAAYQQTVVDNAFIGGYGYEGEEGLSINCLAEENKTKPECAMEACDPAKQDCRWPTRGYITQGPMSSCPGTSHSGTQAIDIGANLTDVYATIDGVVEDAFWGCPDNTGHWGNQCGGMRGNYVILKGASYTLTFYHLSQIVTPVHTGDHVTANMVIGKVDHTGNSSGPHLHFGYRGPGSINSILPVAVPPCVGRSGPCACPFIETK